MNIIKLHDWELDTSQAKQVQIDLAGKVIKAPLSQNIYTIAGVDVSVSRFSRDKGRAAIVVISYPELKIIDLVIKEGRLDFPYIPGLLSFREMPIVLSAFEQLAIKPELVIVDGQGIAHPRRLGLACHMGLFLDIPTIGCAKTRLVGKYDAVGNEAGDYADLILNGEVVGAVLRTKRKVKPLFISPGHKIGIRKAVEIVLSCCRGYKIPEPTRRAHITVNQLRLKHLSSC